MKKQVEKEEKNEIVAEVEEQNDYVPSPDPEPEPITYSDRPLEEIEEARLKFFKTFRVQNTFKWVAALICIAAIIFGFAGIPNIVPKENAKLAQGLSLGICIAAAAIMIIYSVITKRMMNTKMRKYFNFYYKKVNENAFNQEGFSDVVLQEPGKIDVDFFRETNLYKDIVDVGSRGLTEFTYHDIPMRIVDCAGNVKSDKRMRPVFVGKLLHCAGAYLGEQSIVIYFKGNDRALPPTNVNELKVIEDNTKYIIYSNSADAKKVIKPAIKKMLDGIEMNKYLIDLAISLHDGKIFVCFGYDDPLMILPMQNQFDPKPNEQFKKDLGQVIKLVEALNK
ncbi:MAG: hypothetical protein KBS97_00880 [Firmicutes bacterium]|nr:hypothetical protein [Candidatus Fiminaster equi]